MSESIDDPRFNRQLLFPSIGREGQEKLLLSKVAIVGCGALGTTLAELLTRAGVGKLTLIDRDVVEPSNLGRQALFSERDARDLLPKAVALRQHLLEFRPEAEIESIPNHLDAALALDVLTGHDLILDGCDNYETRYLLNDVSLSLGIPWIYGACVGAQGLTQVILPGDTPCLRCLFPDPPPPGVGETCDTSGIIAPAASLVASLQAVEALKILVGDRAAVRERPLSVALWPFRIREVGEEHPRPRPDCEACAQGERPFLDGRGDSRVVVHCGREAVQVIPARRGGDFDLEAFRRALPKDLSATWNGHLLLVEVDGLRLSLFRDGRALILGTSDSGRARALYDRLVGS